MRLTILHKGLIIISIPLIFELFFVVVLVDLLNQSAKHITNEMKSQDKLVSVETMKHVPRHLASEPRHKFVTRPVAFGRLWSQTLRVDFYRSANYSIVLILAAIVSSGCRSQIQLHLSFSFHLDGQEAVNRVRWAKETALLPLFETGSSPRGLMPVKKQICRFSR